METWPETLPVPLSSPSMQVTPMNGRTEMESGRIRKRRLCADPYEAWEVQWNFTEDQFDDFKAFFDTTLVNGSLSFAIDFFGIDREVVFVGGQYSFVRADNLFSVSATLEVVSLVEESA